MKSCSLCFSLVCNICYVRRGVFTLPSIVTGRLFSVIVALPGYLNHFVGPIKIGVQNALKTF